MKRKEFKGNWDNPMRTETKEERKQINEVLERAFKKKRGKL